MQRETLEDQLSLVNYVKWGHPNKKTQTRKATMVEPSHNSGQPQSQNWYIQPQLCSIPAPELVKPSRPSPRPARTQPQLIKPSRNPAQTQPVLADSAPVLVKPSRKQPWYNSAPDLVKPSRPLRPQPGPEGRWAGSCHAKTIPNLGKTRELKLFASSLVKTKTTSNHFCTNLSKVHQGRGGPKEVPRARKGKCDRAPNGSPNETPNPPTRPNSANRSHPELKPYPHDSPTTTRHPHQI